MTERAPSIGRASAALAAGTLVSRVLGFVSAAVLAWAIGPQNPGANAFALANQLPNNIYAIVAAGVLSAVLVPQIVRAGLHADGGQAFVNRLVTLGVVLFVIATAIATLCAPLLVDLYTLDAGAADSALGGGRALAIAFAYWCLPQIFFYAVYSLLGEVLNARQVFGPFTWAPVLNNVVVIVALLVFAAMFGVDPAHQDPASWTQPQILLVAGGATLGIAAQALVLLLFWRRTGLGFRPDFRWRGVGLGGIARAAGWTFGMILVTQLAGIVQSKVAVHRRGRRRLGRGAAHRVAHLHAAALDHRGVDRDPVFHPDERRCPRRRSRRGALGCLRLAARHRDADRRSVRRAGRRRPPLRRGVLQRARRGGEHRHRAARVPGRTRAVQRALRPAAHVLRARRHPHAVPDPAGPVGPLRGRRPRGRRGRAGTGRRGRYRPRDIGCRIVQALVAALVLRHRLGGVGGGRLARSFGVFLLATAPAAAAGVGILSLLGGLPGDGGGFAVSEPVPAVVSVILIGAVTFGVYLGALALARVPEVREIGALVRRLTGRGTGT